MKIGAVVVNRNDGYKDFERGIIHFKSMIDTFDEISYIDWNSPTGSFLWEVEEELPKTGKIKHFVITPSVVDTIIPITDAQKCNEGLSRNIGIRRSECEWIVSTNIDIIPPKREDLVKLIKSLDKDTFYTISRREAPKEIVYKHGKENHIELRNELYETIPARHFPAKVTENDHYSIINCCGDFQLAHKDVWHKVRGFEERMYHACFVDTNVQKKAVLNNFKLEALYNPPLFHMEHGAYYTKKDGTRVSDQENKGEFKGDNKAYNNPYEWVEGFSETKNNESWGLGNTNVQHETF